MTVRRAIFWLHLAAGLVAGSVILVMATTGLMISFERQLVAAVERGTYTVAPPVSGAQPLRPEALVARLRQTMPDARPSGLTLRRDAAAPATASLGRERTVFLNPYNGAVLGEGSWLRSFLHEVERFHRDLALGDTGKAITGACSLAFLALMLTGIYLWFPRRWTAAAVKAVALPNLRLRGKPRDFNWHNALGLWAALPILILTITGAVMSYSWANNLLFRATGNEPPPPRAKPAAGKKPAAPIALKLEGLDQLWLQAEAQAGGWRTISARMQNANALAFVVDAGDGTRPDLRRTLIFNLKSRELERTEAFASYNLGRKLRMWVRPVHTGEAGGIAGQTVAAGATLGTVVLIWTGFALAWRRFRAWRRPPAKAQASGKESQSPNSQAPAVLYR